MENASKALIMAAGVLIGILIISLAVYLFIDFGANSKEIHAQIEEQQLSEYNAQYTIYDGRSDIKIYDIITLANLAKQNNSNYEEYTNYEFVYRVQVTLKTNDGTISNFENTTDAVKQNQIEKYNAVGSDGEILHHFKCNGITYHSDGGRVATIEFKQIN